MTAYKCCFILLSDGCMLVQQRRMAGGKAPKFFIQAPQYEEKMMLRKFVRTFTWYLYFLFFSRLSISATDQIQKRWYRSSE